MKSLCIQDVSSDARRSPAARRPAVTSAFCHDGAVTFGGSAATLHGP
jgi:hypothetical protein